MEKNYVAFYEKEDSRYVVYNSENNTIVTLDEFPTELSKHIFFMQNYDEYKSRYRTDKEEIILKPSKKGLLKYVADFDLWCEQLLNNDIYKFDYKNNYSHSSAVIYMLKQLCKGPHSFENHEPIDQTESKWIEACPNGGLMWCNPQTCESHGYDYKNNHAFNMASTMLSIPCKKGKEIFLTELPKSFEEGYYRVKITAKSQDSYKLFAFSDKHVYTKFQLFYAIKEQKLLNLDIELIVDGQPNAYVYDKKDLLRGNQVFGNWFKIMNALKIKFPKNKLIKFLCSSSWGHLSQIKYKNVPEDEVLENNMTKDGKWAIRKYHAKDNGRSYFELIDPTDVHKYNIRLKPFLMARTRYNIAKIAMLHPNNVVRIQTDNVVFNKEFDDVLTAYPSFGTMAKEEKTTGLIKWSNVNTYEKVKEDE